MTESSNMICPNCKEFQTKTKLCKKCGIDVEAIVKSNVRKEETRSAPVNSNVESKSNNRFVIALFSLIIVGVIIGFYVTGEKDKAQAINLQEHIDNDLFLQALKLNEKSLYLRFEKKLWEAKSNGMDPKNISFFNNAEDMLALNSAFNLASDKAIMKFVRRTEDVLRQLKDKNSLLCYAWILQKKNSNNFVFNLIGEKYKTSLYGSLAELINSKGTQEKINHDYDLAKEKSNEIIDKLKKKYGEEAILLTSSPDLAKSKDEKALVCKVTNSIYSALTFRNRVLISRYILSNSVNKVNIARYMSSIALNN